MRLTTFERVTATTVAAIAAVAMATPLALRGAQETQTVDKTVPFPSGGVLQLNNFSGDVHITGTSGKDVVIKAVRRGDREELDHITLDIQTVGSTVRIEANKRDAAWDRNRRDKDVVETTFDIQVPASARLVLDVFSSNVDIKGVSGSQRIEAFSGDIVVDAVAAGATPSLSVKTFSGNIRARLTDAAKGDVDFDSFSGSFDSELPVTMRTSSRGRVRAGLPGGSSGAPAQTLSFETFSGNVRIVK